MFDRKYVFGDTAVYYLETPLDGFEGKSLVGLCAYPKDAEVQKENLHPASLVQVAFSDDDGLLDYADGVTMCCRSSSLLKVAQQTATDCSVTTLLSDGEGNEYTHELRYSPETGVFEVQITYKNRTGRTRTLEKLASFALGGITSRSGGEQCGLTLHRMTSAWSRECRLQSLPFSAIGMEPSWAHYGLKCERWGQAGSMSNRGWYPFAAVEDREASVVWGVEIEAPYSWQFDLFGEKTCTLSGGLADFAFGHWRKEIPDGGTFQTHRAFFTVRSSLNGVFNALLHEADRRLSVPASEETMPVLFNEYCTTWGNPCAENIEKILEAVRPFPLSYFVIDCGWYKPEDKGWCNATGDWVINKSMFPAGLPETVKKINRAGLKAGIWFEYEISGRDSEKFYDEREHLHRDGRVITSKNRRFLDLRLPSVQRYLKDRVLSTLVSCGFGYLKIDYNDSYGIGCDGAESYGEGGRAVAEESISFLDKIRETVPGIVLENCASGGSRIEPLRMSKVSMCSFSDAHECAEIPFVAANVSRVVPARQIQIWAVLREGETDARTVYSLCAAMIGRICLSGDVLSLSEEKRKLIQAGLEFYNGAKEVVRFGDIEAIDCNVEYYRKPFGRQIYIKTYQNQILVIAHFADCAERVLVDVGGSRLISAFTDLSYHIENGKLILDGKPFSAGAFLLKRE